jgi:hypothetical protein
MKWRREGTGFPERQGTAYKLPARLPLRYDWTLGNTTKREDYPWISHKGDPMAGWAVRGRGTNPVGFLLLNFRLSAIVSPLKPWAGQGRWR